MKSRFYFFLILSFIFFHCEKDAESYTRYSNYPQNPYNHDLDPGSSAKDFLRGTYFKSLKIEIQYMPGLEPDPLAIDMFIDLLEERLNKPLGIFVELKGIDPTLKTTFTTEDISNIESQNRTVFSNGNQLGAYILIVNGAYYSGVTLGLAYKNTSVCLFGESLKYFSIGITDNTKVKIIAMLLEHEFGHLLGLVDMGTSMDVDHLDARNGNHCDNSKCLMHHTYEANAREFIRSFVDIPSFDANCLADMHANGGK
jgi:hypothetical protein